MWRKEEVSESINHGLVVSIATASVVALKSFALKGLALGATDQPFSILTLTERWITLNFQTSFISDELRQLEEAIRKWNKFYYCVLCFIEAPTVNIYNVFDGFKVFIDKLDTFY